MNIKILVAYHKPSAIYARKDISGEALQPILLGAQNAQDSTIQTLESMCATNGVPLVRDDSGDNISALNPYYCELTAMYWAWKNLKADVYGLFHYRRALDLSGTIKVKIPNDVNKIRIAPHKIATSFALTQENIESKLKECDIITASRYICGYAYEAYALNQYEIYSRDHHQKDLDILLEVIREKYPHYEEAIQKVFFTRGKCISYCNVFVMKKDLYFEYCEWLFDILFEVAKRVDLTYYPPYQQRIYGFMAERLLNVFVVHKEMTSHTRIKTHRLWVIKESRPFFGWSVEGNIRRFFICKLRVKKEIINDK